ncbi:MAG: proton-conducting transporter membrane subunit [Negativicutes bacterium]
MFPYFLELMVVVPLLGALFFLQNKNSLLHRGAVFFMTLVFIEGAFWALWLGNGFYQPTGQLSDGLNFFFVAGNAAVVVVLGYGSMRWKDWTQGGLAMAQGILLGWVLWQTGQGVASGSFRLDHLSALMMVLVDGVGVSILLVAIRTMGKGRQPLFIAMVMLLLGSMNGLVLSNHLLWMFFFWQTTVLSAFGLLVLSRTPLALTAAKYFVKVCSVGSIAFLVGISLIFSGAGTLLISELLVFKDATLLMAPMACFVVAGLVLSAQFPFQDALVHSSIFPDHVLALLQSSSTVIAGVYLILRLSPLFMNTWLAKMVAVIGAFTFAAALLSAAMQQNSKRFLTLTTSSSMGLTITLACFSSLQAIYAAILLVVLHGAAKACLLLCSSSRSRSPIPEMMTLLCTASLLTPPFGAPIAQWTAIEASVRNLPAMGLLIAGSVFSMIVWTRFIGKRLSTIESHDVRLNGTLLQYTPQLVLATGLTGISIFLLPFANHFVMPVLKENYGRFDDIAQGNVESLILQDFSGVNPLLYFMALGVVFVLGWFVNRTFAKQAETTSENINKLPDMEGIFLLEIEAELAAEREAADEETESADRSSDPKRGLPIDNEVEPDAVSPEREQSQTTTAETIRVTAGALAELGIAPEREFAIKPVGADEKHAPVLSMTPRCSIFAVFPDAKQTYLFATVIGGALIILMLEVVFR